MRPTRESVLGCLVGGALGDGVGGLRERSGFSLSDDTQLTLATCEALGPSGGVDPAEVAAAFTR